MLGGSELPKRETGGRFSEVRLAQACSPHKAGLSRLAVERRRHRVVLTGGNDGGLCLLNLLALEEPPRAVIAPSTVDGGAGHDKRIEVARWLPADNRLFVSGSGDSSLKVWDATATRQSVLSIDLRSTVHAAELTGGPPSMIAAALGDNTLRMVDLRLGRSVNTLQGHTQPPLCVAWGAADSHQLYSGGKDGTLRAWDRRIGARSLFLFDPYADDANAPPLKKLERSDEELLKSKGCPLQSSPEEKLTLKPRVGPYVPTSMGRYLGTDRPRATGARTHGRLDATFRGTGIMSAQGTALAASSVPSVPSASLIDPERERLRREKWTREAEERARHFMEPVRREYEHEPSHAHRGAVVAVVFLTRQPPGTAPRLLSCGVDGRVRVWDPSAGVLAGPRAFDVECSSTERPLQVGALGGAGGDVCFVPEENTVAAYCVVSGEPLCTFAAHTAAVTSVDALASCRRGGVPLEGPMEVFSGGDDGRLLCWRVGVPTPPRSNAVIEID